MIKAAFKIIEKSNIKYGDTVICAVSGGIDSVSMLHVLKLFGVKCIVAHCNFKLRKAESDRDEKFVESLAKKLNFKFEVKSFDTEKYALENKISIQMAARELRFDFFDKLLLKYKCNYIALGHNSDDRIETVLTNFIRGTGLRGLTGMCECKSNIIRPLLNVSRKQISDFANKKGIDFCLTRLVLRFCSL